MRNSQRRFSFTVSIKARSSRTPPRTQHSRNIITRNTIPARENYGGIFPGCTSTKPVRASAAGPCARPRCCLSVNSYVRASVYRCVRDIRGCMRSRLKRFERESQIQICAASRYEDAGNAANAKGTEVIHFLLLLTLISAFSSDLDRKANGKSNEGMPGKRVDTCSGNTNTILSIQRENMTDKYFKKHSLISNKN